MTLPAIYTSAHVDSRQTVEWDSDSFTVRCAVEHASPSSSETGGSFSEELERRFDIVPRTYVITAGTLSMLLDSEKRLKELDFYTNAEKWVECAFPYVDALSGTPHIEAIFDENGHATMMDPDVFYEPRRGTLYLSWSNSSTWCAVAPRIALGVGSDHRLTQIRLDGLFVETTKQGPKGLWAKLLRRDGAGT
ncbi:hypothetical protein AWB78_00475 [Caballeronia calidae]|uniref:Uncharacterized protein n=1 Tax=Caballeronia calidae TaxID=1777139 RepID=A0A157ZF16_9BURK|nr:hypothetical protein [Caballeronia calidae]SAK44086.1 hypothetical protein AWB78_00475 [Caballeronia calidae]